MEQLPPALLATDRRRERRAGAALDRRRRGSREAAPRRGIAAVLFYGSCLRNGDDRRQRRRSLSAGGQLREGPPWPADAPAQPAAAAERIFHRDAVRRPHRARQVCASHVGAVRAPGRPANVGVVFLGALRPADGRALGARAGDPGADHAGARDRGHDDGARDARSARARTRRRTSCGRGRSARRIAPNCAPKPRSEVLPSIRRSPRATTRSRASLPRRARPIDARCSSDGAAPNGSGAGGASWARRSRFCAC